MDSIELKKRLEEADMVLVGIGEDFEEKRYLQQDDRYCEACGQIAQAEAEWVMPYVNRLFLKDNNKLRTAYQTLAGLLEGKNYFILTSCMDGLIRETSIKQERIVEPCGTYSKMQCISGCANSVCDTNEQLLEQIENCCFDKKDWSTIDSVRCKQCNGPVVLNSLYAEHYAEEGYSGAWSLYTKWLQGTVNKKLCILELGSGMMFANILRFRFEKIVGLNQKSSLIRIHKNLYQVPVEISDRGQGISQNAVDFMAEIAEIC
ncbi:MAG: hypothetical protein IJX66_11705 [Lachnospiraceae bacterium]|nr:hypothetical protein [Lachnospiraceae bacterium]